LFLPEAVITRVKSPAIEVMTVRDFLTPRAALLLDGRLTEFAEHEVASELKVEGALAQRSSRYEKSGILEGVSFHGDGQKLFQFVRTVRGWKIAALAWQDIAA
jgi:hypothetical protein